jgi:tRNA-dihydrouridine synthase
MYEGEVHLGAFAAVYRLCRAPVTYNGDIFTVSDFLELRARLPEITRWMLGRGLVSDPFLPIAIREADAGRTGGDPATAAALMAFHDDLYARCRSELFGPASILGRMKELWGYLHERCENGHLLLRYIQRCHKTGDYERIVDDWFVSVGRLVPICPRIAVCR